MTSKTLLLSLAVVALAARPGAAPAQNRPQAARPVAVVAGQSISEDELAAAASSQLTQLRNQEYELKRRALDGLIRQKLLEAEAKKRAVPPERLLQLEADNKVGDPNESEVESFYLAQKDRLNRPLAEVRAQLAIALKRAKVQSARETFLDSLREKADVTVLLRPPKMEVGFDPTRLRGNPKAPVTIVEFSDFECPFCVRVQPVLQELLAKYEGKVSLAYRDFPLREMHPKAQSAAEASRCAGEQGKFWEYHDALFANPAKLDAASLGEHARSLALDGKQFESCLTSGRFRSKVEEDIQQGSRAGVSGTPGFFINGVFLNGAQPRSAFEKIIDEELAAAGRP